MHKNVAIANNDPIIASQMVEDIGPRILQVVEAARIKPLNRYNLQDGKLFGLVKGKERFRVLRLSGNIIVYKDLVKDQVEYKDIDQLVEEWNMKNYVEISNVDLILEKIKSYLQPILGSALMAVLISWVLKKLG